MTRDYQEKLVFSFTCNQNKFTELEIGLMDTEGETLDLLVTQQLAIELSHIILHGKFDINSDDGM